MTRRGAGCLVAGVFLLVCGCAHAAGAQSLSAPAHSPNGASRKHGGDHLRFVLIVTRHGVRSPTWTQSRLDSYSTHPWPKWNVDPGNLTERGFELVRKFGTFDRELFFSTGLLSPSGCNEASSIYIWADVDQRTRESGRAIAEGLLPGCGLAVHGQANGKNDTLFHSGAKNKMSSGAQLKSARSSLPEQEGHGRDEATLIGEMQNVLLDCAPKGPCSPMKRPDKMLLPEPAYAVKSKGDDLVEVQSSLPEASSIAEDFLLEFTNGMAMADVGWGHVDERELRRLIGLHSEYFQRAHQNPNTARAEAGNLLNVVVQTLRQAAEGKSVDEAMGPVGSKVVVLVGHDTNIASLAALLGLHWTLDGRSDDTPPGTEMSFELWQAANDAWYVRVTVSMQTLRQMRFMRSLSLSAPPAIENIGIPGCGSKDQGCSLEDFGKVAGSAMTSGAVSPVN